jgi:hypothetical protein
VTIVNFAFEQVVYVVDTVCSYASSGHKVAPINYLFWPQDNNCPVVSGDFVQVVI